MLDTRASVPLARCRFGHILIGSLVLSLAFVALTPRSSNAGFLLPTSVKKTVTSFLCSGKQITVWRYEPKKARGRLPALVMLHGLECLSESPKHYEFIAERFAAKGYSVYFVHYFNCTPVAPGKAAALQERVKAALCPVQPGMAPDEQVRKYFEDWVGVVKGGIKYARSQKNVDPDRVGVIGFSLGGFLTMSLVAMEPDLKVAAAVECFGGLPKELHAALKNAPPVLIFHGDRDKIVPVREAHALRALLKDRKCQVEDKIFENCGHMFLGDKGTPRLDQIIEAERICLRFLDRHMNHKTVKKTAP